MFGAYRRELPTGAMDQMDADARRERELRAASLRRAITEAETKSKRLLRGLELVENPDQRFIQDLHERRAELHGQQADLERQLAGLEVEIQGAPNPDLLAELPITPVDVTALLDAPQDGTGHLSRHADRWRHGRHRRYGELPARPPGRDSASTERGGRHGSGE